MTFRLQYAAISDVGRVRKDNQDSGYAGPWLLTVCDGVGGAARGDIASATAVGQLRKLDAAPPPDHTPEDLLGQVAGALHRAHDRIAELVDQDPALNGTATTATVGLFDGHVLAMGHVGDSRGYLFRGDEIRQLTKDHTFVQTLVDDGRIDEAESRVHPHRNLILKALDGAGDVDPDLFLVELEEGDRILLCSDGASGSLEDGRMADILSSGSVDFAAVELVRAAIEAGSTDNVTCLVAEVRPDTSEEDDTSDPLPPIVVGAAADLRRKGRGGGQGSRIFRGHRSGDTGEIEPIAEEIAAGEPLPREAIESDPLDPEAARYAPRPPRHHVGVRRALALLGLLGVAWMLGAAGWSWTQTQYYVGESDGVVTIYRGVDADIPGLTLSHPYETSDLEVSSLDDYHARSVQQGISADSLAEAEKTVQNLASTTSGGS